MCVMKATGVTLLARVDRIARFAGVGRLGLVTVVGPAVVPHRPTGRVSGLVQVKSLTVSELYIHLPAVYLPYVIRL